jgi:hypothetical protein
LEAAARTQARTLAGEGKLAVSQEDFVSRIMASARRQLGRDASEGLRRTRLLTELTQGTSPRITALLNRDAAAMQRLLREHGNWKHLIESLHAGTPEMQQVARNLGDYRASVVRQLEERFGARPLGGASTEPISDVDLQLTGNDAGRRMIEAENWMRQAAGDTWGDMFRMAFYTEGTRLFQYADVMRSLPRAARAALQARLTRLSERFNLAKMLRHAGDDAEAVGRVETLARSVGADLDDIRGLARIEESAGLARRNELLTEVDGLAVQYDAARAAGNRAEQIRLAEAITSRQVEANFFTREAYVAPGAGRAAVREVAVIGHEAYQTALSQMEMIEHVVHESGGDVLRALREYELLKYVNRFAAAARQAGLERPGITYFENLSEYVYRVHRGAHAEGAALPADWLGRSARSPRPDRPDLGGFYVRPSDLPVERPPVDEGFLRSQFQEFQREANEVLPELRRRAFADSAAWATGDLAVRPGSGPLGRR